MNKKVSTIALCVCMVVCCPQVRADGYLSYLHAQGNIDFDSSYMFINKVAQKENSEYILKQAAMMALLADDYNQTWTYLQQIEDLQFSYMFRIVNLINEGEYNQALSIIEMQEDDYYLPIIESWIHVAKGDKKKALSSANDISGELGIKKNLHKGLIYNYFGDFKKANKYFSKISEGLLEYSIDDNNKGIKFIDTVEKAMFLAFLDVAEASFVDMGSPGALPYVKSAMFLNADTDDLKYLSAKLNMSIKLYARANKEFNEISLTSSRNKDAQRSILELLLIDGSYEAAIAHIKSSMELDAENLNILANLYLELENYESAIDYYTQALDINQDNIAGLYFYRGVVFDKLGEKDKRDSDVLKSIELNPVFSDALNYLGYSWLNEDSNIEEAFGMVAKAVKISPNAANIDSLGWGYYKLGDYKKAEALLEHSAKLLTNNIEVLSHLADVYEAQGKLIKANYARDHITALKKN